MGQALVRSKTTTETDYDIVFTLQLCIGLLLYLVFFLMAPSFAKWYQNPLYSDLLRVSALSFIFRPFVNLPSNILHRQMRFKALSIVSVISLLGSSAISIGMAMLGYGVWSLIFGGIMGAIISALIFIPLARWRPRLTLQLRRSGEIARFGMFVTINDILFYLRNQTSVFLLSHTLGPASVGLYNKGESLAKMPHTFITGSVYQVLFRALAAVQDNPDKCRYLFFRSITLVAVYATPFYIGFIWLSEPLVRGVYGAKWVEAASPLFILAFAWPFMLMDNLSGAVLAARNWLDREVLVQGASLIIAGLAVLIGTSHGIEGVAYAIVGTYVYSALHMYWLAGSCLKAGVPDFVLALIPAAILNIILAATLSLTDQALSVHFHQNDLAYVAIMSAVGGLVYLLSFLFLPIRTLRTEQLRWKEKLRFNRLRN